MCPSTGGLAQVQSDQLCYGLLSQLQIQVLLCLPMLPTMSIKLPVVVMFLKILFTSNDCWRVICSKWIQMLWSIMQYKMNLEAKVKYNFLYFTLNAFIFSFVIIFVLWNLFSYSTECFLIHTIMKLSLEAKVMGEMRATCIYFKHGLRKIVTTLGWYQVFAVMFSIWWSDLQGP